MFGKSAWQSIQDKLLKFCCCCCLFACENLDLLTWLLGINWGRANPFFPSFFSPCPCPGQKKKKNVFHTNLLSPHYLKVTNFQSFITLAILVTFLVCFFDLLFSVSIIEQISPFYNVVVLLHYCVQSVCIGGTVQWQVLLLHMRK